MPTDAQQFRMTLTAEGVYLRAGPYTRRFTLDDQFRPARPLERLKQVGLLLYWPKSLDWLRASGTVAPADLTGGPGMAFVSDGAGLEKLAEAHATGVDQITPPKFFDHFACLAASVPAAHAAGLTVEIDTDSPAFRAAARAGRNADRGEFVVPINVMFFDSVQYKQLATQQGQVNLALRPCVPQAAYRGLVAVDLGNTTSTAIALAETAVVYKSSSLRGVPLESPGPLAESADPLESVLRLDNIRSTTDTGGARRFPGGPDDELPGAVRFAAGRLVTAGAGGGELPPGVVVGAKQLLSAKPKPGENGRAVEPHFTTRVPHERGRQAARPEDVDVLMRVPGELLFAHAVYRFRQSSGCWPPELTLTYPTTYSPGELRQLQKAAARGWLRAMGMPQSTGAPPDEDFALEGIAGEARDWLESGTSPCRLLPFTIDEASAAAFFHLYREVFEKPGGLVRFRYVYPRGMRMLLVDCGGGTTDVALVSATSPAADKTLLEIDVIARTGVRTFGGDRITHAVCRLLKARLLGVAARAAGNAARPVPTIPQVAALTPAAVRAVKEYLDKSAELDPTNKLVPTTFDATRYEPSDGPRRTCANALWQLGEAVKRKLGGNKPVKLKDVDATHTGRDNSPLIAAILRPIPLANQAAVLAQIQEISLSPAEVDALIQPDIQKLVKKCNEVIKAHLVRDAYPSEAEVDRVVLSGNGARYPLVRKLLAEGLAVPSAGDRMTSDPDNMKHAVAKGAALARMVQRVPQKVRIRFTRRLDELLPFDLGYHTLHTNRTKPLFREFTSYVALADAPKKVKLETDGEAGAAGNAFFLDRKFPGDDEWTPYATYHFPTGIQGELEIRYNRDTGEFDVTDTATGLPGAFTDLTAAEHLPLAMRGDI